MTDLLQGTNLPDGRLILDLITSKKLDDLKSMLDPLPIHHRRFVVNQNIQDKTLLYYVCELGYTDIAKYLLVECDVSVMKGYWNGRINISPMCVAMKNLDLLMVLALMKWTQYFPIDYALEEENYWLACLLGFYHDENFPPVVHIPLNFENDGVFPFFLLRSYHERSRAFFTACSRGFISKAKLLLTCGVNLKYQNSLEENSLYAAIFFQREGILNFLLNKKIYSLKDYALALELLGAKLIVFQRDSIQGLECWKQSVRIRQENGFGFRDKEIRISKSDFGMEFQTIEQLEEFELRNDENVYIQALLVFLRILPRTSFVVHTAFLAVAENEILKEQLMTRMRILSELIYFPAGNSLPYRNRLERVFSKSMDMFKSYFLSNFSELNEFMTNFIKLLDFLNNDTWSELLLSQTPRYYRFCYIVLLEFVIIRILYLEVLNLDFKTLNLIKPWIEKLQKKGSYPYPTTLLHLAIPNEAPISVIQFILDCSSDSNCSDIYGDTPLHKVSYSGIDLYQFLLMKLLVRYGAHIDSVNHCGYQPYDYFRLTGMIRNPLPYISLQCLAAQAVFTHGIPVSEGNYPKALIKFIKLHSA